MNLFVYGTLLFDEVRDQVASSRYRYCPGHVTGYKRVKVQRQIYPALIKGHGTVDGRLLFDITSEDLIRLDAFEGAYFNRRSVTVATEKDESMAAEVYELNPNHYDIIEDEPWIPADFKQHDLPIFLRTYFGFDKLNT